MLMMSERRLRGASFASGASPVVCGVARLLLLHDMRYCTECFQVARASFPCSVCSGKCINGKWTFTRSRGPVGNINIGPEAGGGGFGTVAGGGACGVDAVGGCCVAREFWDFFWGVWGAVWADGGAGECVAKVVK